MANTLLIFLAIIFVLLNAFFVAAEFSMVKIRPTQIADIKRKYGFKGKILALVHKNLDNYLSACQLGITFSSLSLGWIGEPAFASLLKDTFIAFNITIFSEKIIHIIAFSFGFFIISFLHIVIGELVPKSLAIRRTVILGVWTAIPLHAFYVTMYPALWLLNYCSNYLLAKAGVHVTNKDGNFFSTREIKLILHASHCHGELTKEETAILKHTLEFADLNVSEVSKDYNELLILNSKQNLVQVSKVIREHGYSSYPVYDDNKKDFIGLLHLKDLFILPDSQLKSKDITLFMRPLIKVSADTLAIELFQKFREGNSDFALVHDQNNIIIGFVTLDNLLHKLIGYVKDEFYVTQ